MINNIFNKGKSPKPPRSELARRMRLMLIIVVAIFGLIFLFDIARSILMKRFFAHFALPTVTISSTKAQLETWTPSINAIGSLLAVNSINVSSQLPGMVVAIKFQSGQMVKEGDPLVQLDDRTDLQDLANLNAQLQLAQLNYQRQVNLLKTNATAQSVLDQASAQLQQNQSQVAKTKLLIQEKLISAPFNGKLGIRNVNLGQYISPGVGLVNLQSMDPLHVQFSLPEQYLKSLYIGQPLEFTVTDYPEQIFKGNISALESSVNVVTRNIQIEGLVPNGKQQLYPGMFANIRVVLPTKRNVVTVPQTAIAFSLYGDSIFVINQDGKDENGKPIFVVHQRYVTTGDRQGDRIAVVEGLKAGEEVVTAGQLKLQDGAQVLINNNVKLPKLTPEETKSA